jgi:hypothetical protein
VSIEISSSIIIPGKLAATAVSGVINEMS